MSTVDVLLVCTPSVLARLERIDAGDGHVPPWVDRALVTDEELASAQTLRLVTGGDTGEDGVTHGELMTRIRGLGFTNASLQVAAIRDLEARVEARARAAVEKQAKEDERALRWKRAQRAADDVLAAEDAVTHRVAEVMSLGDELDLEMPEEQWVVDGFVHDEGRTVIGGFRKAGKTVFALNLAAAIASGEPFLDRYEVRKPDPDRTVGWLNLELTRTMARRWVHGLGGWVPRTALERIVGAHLRGAASTYAVTTKAGEEALYRFLCEQQVETLLMDPVGPLMSVCGLDVNSGKDVGRFLTTMDRIVARAETRQVIYTAHIGKASAADDGNETVKGDTRWEDSVDAIVILGKEPHSGVRWLRTEGRGMGMDNVTLVYDEELQRLTLDPLRSRRDAELRACAEQVLGVVRANPGIQTEALLGNPVIVGTKGKRKAGRDEAVRLGWITKVAGQGSAIEHHALV